MTSIPQISEGVFLYLLGIVIIAARPDRFWLCLTLAMIPLLIGSVGRAIGGDRWKRI